MSSIGSGALDRILSRVRALTNARRTGRKEKAAAASVVALVYLAVVFRQGKLVCRRSGHNVRVLRALAGVVDRPYYPSWLTPNAHVNCLLGYAKRGITVKYLGEEGRNGLRPLAGAVSVSNPWNFEDNTMAGGRAKGLVAAVMGKVYSLALATGVKIRGSGIH
ncbi:unnamed protein product [Ectocarpus sp. CCAP 1310/34]|nr:unnamed protein product [Ectocarpus sp. CCAP 1310/34]